MPSYCSVLVAIVFVVTITSSVSNQASASAQLVKVPSDESHSSRSLRSLRVADAGLSINEAPTSDVNPNEHKEKGFFKGLLDKVMFHSSVLPIRFTASEYNFGAKFATSPAKVEKTRHHLDPANFPEFHDDFKMWNELDVTPDQLEASLNIDTSDSMGDTFKRKIVESYRDFRNGQAQAKPTN